MHKCRISLVDIVVLVMIVRYMVLILDGNSELGAKVRMYYVFGSFD